MIDGLIRWSLRHRPIVIALAAAFLIWGGWTATRIPLDVLPDLTAPTVTILAEAPGMDPLEIESLVTFPIESALNGAAGVRRVRSATAVGVAVVWVEFDWGQDINRARQTVTEKLTLVSGSLPPNVEPPFLAPVSSIMGEVLFIDLESDRHSPLELRTIAETVVRRRLLAVPGVSQVIATGGEQKQYQVVLDPIRLAAHQVTLQEVEKALIAANQNATAGFQVAQGQEIPRARCRPSRVTPPPSPRSASRPRTPPQCSYRTWVSFAKARRSSGAKARTMPSRPSSLAFRNSRRSTRWN